MQSDKSRRANSVWYANRYHLLKKIVDFNFKPKKIVQKYKGEIVREYEEFTPAQKSLLTKLSSKKNDEGMRENSHLYNVARNVDAGTAVLKTLPKSKTKEKKLKALKKSGIFTTNKGFITFSAGASDIKLKKRGKSYLIEYVVKLVPPKSGEYTQVYERYSKQIFIPIPLHIWQHEDLLSIFLADLEREYDPKYFNLAINGRLGKNSFDPKTLYKYITEKLYSNFEIDNPFITGVFLIFKDVIKKLPTKSRRRNGKQTKKHSGH